MAYDRYDTRRSAYRGPREGRPSAYDREDRGFFERARDEVTSWFGDERAEQRRDYDERADQRFEGGSYGTYERSPRWRDEGGQRPYTGRPDGRSYGEEYGFRSASRNDRWDRGQTQRHEQAGASGLYDRDYSNWRNRQIDDLDRDYAEFRRENSARFENEFTTWRGQRQSKRELLGQVTEHMDVVGSDMESVGKVDFCKNDKVILTKSDSPDGRHHTIAITRIDRIDGDKLVLDMPAAEVKQRFDQEQRSGALFDRDGDNADGPHMLNRSFSGTY
jgi:hypothetical protein